MNGESAKYGVESLLANMRIAVKGDFARIVVAGCNDVDAVGQLAMQIANCLASDDGKMVVVGCGRVATQQDLPLGVSERFGASAFARGLCNAGDAIRESGMAGVDVVCFDAANENQSGIVADKSFLCLLDKLSIDYRCVVVAAPFAHETVDASVLASVSDVTVLAAKVGTTRRKDLATASDNLKRASENVAGICMIDDAH